MKQVTILIFVGLLFGCSSENKELEGALQISDVTKEILVTRGVIVGARCTIDDLQDTADFDECVAQGVTEAITK